LNNTATNLKSILRRTITVGRSFFPDPGGVSAENEFRRT
jgi:hypothetical protein